MPVGRKRLIDLSPRDLHSGTSSYSYTADDIISYEGNRVFVGEFVLLVSRSLRRKRNNDYVWKNFSEIILSHGSPSDYYAREIRRQSFKSDKSYVSTILQLTEYKAVL